VSNPSFAVRIVPPVLTSAFKLSSVLRSRRRSFLSFLLKVLKVSRWHCSTVWQGGRVWQSGRVAGCGRVAGWGRVAQGGMVALVARWH